MYIQWKERRRLPLLATRQCFAGCVALVTLKRRVSRPGRGGLISRISRASSSSSSLTLYACVSGQQVQTALRARLYPGSSTPPLRAVPALPTPPRLRPHGTSCVRRRRTPVFPKSGSSARARRSSSATPQAAVTQRASRRLTRLDEVARGHGRRHPGLAARQRGRRRGEAPRPGLLGRRGPRRLSRPWRRGTPCGRGRRRRRARVCKSVPLS